MDKIIYLYKITCPECETVQFGFFGEIDEEFCCNAEIKVIRGKKESIEECNYCDDIHHLPEGSYELVAEITIIDGKPVIRNIKKE